MADLWIIPGAPLAHGRGWRVWCSRGDGAPLEEPSVQVRLDGTGQAITTRFVPLAGLPHSTRSSGVLEIELAHPRRPGALYEIWIPAGAARPFRWRSLPDQLTRAGPDSLGSLTLLLASCFYRPNDAEGTYAAGLRDLCQGQNVSLKALVGDQVYTDWPPASPLTPPEQMFTEPYERYWGDDLYRSALALTPNVFASDDHEFWNDYPERQWHLLHTRSAKLRAEYGAAARAAFVAYQQSANPDGRAFFRIDVPPLSIFFADSRSERDPMTKEPHHFFSEEQWAAFDQWVATLAGPAVLVLGQPLFQVAGNWRDHSLANFASDHARLWRGITNVLDGAANRAAHDMLVLTGDLHWGRHAFTQAPSGRALHELAASPASNIGSGPFVGRRKDALAPSRITTETEHGLRVWKVATVQTRRVPTNDNNVAVVRFSLGTNARVRCELATWQVRPVDDRWFWQRDLGDVAAAPLLQQLYSREIELE